MSRSFFRKHRGKRFESLTLSSERLPPAPAAGEPPVQAAESSVEYIRYLYESTRKWYATAETKAQLLLTVNGAFVTIIFGTVFSRNNELQANAIKFDIGTWLLLGISAVALAGAISCAGLCLWSMHGKAAKELVLLAVDPGRPDTYKAEALWYFGHIARLQAPAAVNAIRKADQKFEVNALSYNVVDLARKVYLKHRWVNAGWGLTALSLITFAAAGSIFFLEAKF